MALPQDEIDSEELVGEVEGHHCSNASMAERAYRPKKYRMIT